MIVLVSDTSVLIDLERAGLLEVVFALDATFVVPDLLYRRELEPFGGERLLKLGLKVETLQPEETERAQKLRAESRALSVPDTFAFSLASSRKWILLSGDGVLRALADKSDVPCHGVLWVVDRLEESGNVSNDDLHRALSDLDAHPRCRLPKREIRIRLARYAAGA